MNKKIVVAVVVAGAVVASRLRHRPITTRPAPFDVFDVDDEDDEDNEDEEVDRETLDRSKIINPV